jgi:hypothetical protein
VLLFISVVSATVQLTINPQHINPQDSTFQLQAAVKNMATNAVFYFVVPLDATVLLQKGNPDVGAFANEWKALDESHEVSKLIKGEFING